MMEKPIRNCPRFFIISFLDENIRKPKAIIGTANNAILTENPSEVTHAVSVVPILAPIMTPTALPKDSKPAFTKLTTMIVVADEDWTRAVRTVPVRTRLKAFEVIEAMKVATISGTGMSEAQAALSAAQADMSSAQHAFQVSKNAILYGIAALHTLFNVTNTLILIWFVPLIVKVVTWMVKEPKGEEEVFRLKYIAGGPLSTAELSLNEAQHEVVHFAEICNKGFGYIKAAVNEQDPEKFNAVNDKLVKYEEITDRIEFEIASYLNDVSKNDISDEASERVKAMYKIIGEMESLGDSGEAIGRILKRKNAHGKVFDKSLLDRLNRMLDVVQRGYDVMIENLRNGELKEISNAVNCEYNINECRNHLREEHITNIESDSYHYLTGVYYMDVVAELEKIGDFLINISEAAIVKNEK